MSRVIVESPFAGGFENVKYSRRCLRDSLDRGESPFASHLLYTQRTILDDGKPDERKRGIEAANAWLEVSDYVVVYCDRGMTKGMALGVLKALEKNKPIKFRWIDDGSEIEHV